MIKIFITGPPGSGKTTVVTKLYENLKMYNFRVGGIITSELRENNIRVGFEIKALDTGEKAILAHINIRDGPRVGKYRVNIKGLEDIGVQAIKRALTNCDIIIVDEIGPMELKSAKFIKAVNNVLDSKIPAVLTVHYKISTNLHNHFQTRWNNILYMVTEKNREALPLLIWRALRRYIKNV